MGTRYIITSPQNGVYLGRIAGIGFWTKGDSAGCPAAATFSSPDSAHRFVSDWHLESQEYDVVAVECKSHPRFIMLWELQRQGFGDLLGDAMEKYLLEAPYMGSA